MNRVGNILDIEGKVSVVTGAGQGVGRQIAIHLASYGSMVVVNDFYLDRAREVVKDIESFGGSALPLQADVSSFDEVGAMMDATKREFGSIDVLVNNAGSMGPKPVSSEDMVPFWESTPQDWQKWFGANLYGVMNCTRHALASMVDSHSGSIISIVSEAGRYGDAGVEAYAGAKAGVAGVMRSVARGAARYGVRANSVAIAATRTPATAEAFADEEAHRKSLRLYPLRRVGEPTDVANMVLFLASDASSYVTGQTYAVNGGFLFTL